MIAIHGSPRRWKAYIQWGAAWFPLGDRLWHCCYYTSAMKPLAQYLLPWFGQTRALLANVCRSNTLKVSPSGKYELRPAVKKLYQLRPELSTPNMTSCVPQLVRNCISCIERYGYTKCPTIGRFLHSFIVLYFIQNYMHTYRIVERHRQHSCYIMLLYNV